MKRKLFIIVLLLIIGCDKVKEQYLSSKFSIKEFKQWNVKKQTKFMQTLNENEQIKFLAVFLPNSAFIVPPYEYVKFYPDGEIIFDWLLEKGGFAGGNIGDNKFNYLIGHWKLNSNKIIVTKDNEDISCIKDYEEWIGFKVDDYNRERPLSFIVLSNNSEGISLDYIQEYQETTPAIEAYTKLKEGRNK